MHKLLAINLTDEFWVRFDFSWLLVGLLVLVLLGALWRQRGFR
jgi:hypothetical protein